MKDFLIDVIKKLAKINVQGDVKANGKRMFSAIVIIYSLYKLIPVYIYRIDDIPSYYIITLLSLLYLFPDVKNQKCEDWNHLCSLIPGTFVKTLHEAIRTFADHSSSKVLFRQPSWLFAIPVMHFLKGVSHPFKEVEYEFEKISWDSEFTIVKKKTQNESSPQ